MVLPLLCFDAEDAELWEEDPQEFVRKVRTHPTDALLHRNTSFVWYRTCAAWGLTAVQHSMYIEHVAAASNEKR